MEPTAVYRFYDIDGALLYTGISRRPGFRFSQHEAAKEWWGRVARIELTWEPSRDAALAVESHLIRTLHPIHNGTHAGMAYTPTGKVRVRAHRRRPPQDLSVLRARVLSTLGEMGVWTSTTALAARLRVKAHEAGETPPVLTALEALERERAS